MRSWLFKLRERRLKQTLLVVPAALAFVLLASVGADAATYPNPGRVTGSIGVHDPSMTRATNGTYLLVSTGNNLPIKTSTDRVAFRDAGVVWPNGAPWTTQYTNGSANLWAPDISFHNGPPRGRGPTAA